MCISDLCLQVLLCGRVYILLCLLNGFHKTDLVVDENTDLKMVGRPKNLLLSLALLVGHSN